MEGKTTLTEFRKMNSVKKKRIVRKNMWCWVFMLPTLFLYILFQGYPIITSAWYSMLDWSGMTMNATFVGLQNFKELLADPLFKNSVVNSFKYMIFSVPIQLILSLVIALLGIDTINFLGDEKTALFTVVLIGIWKDLGTYMIYWIAALQSVSQDVYEAAKIDGAGKFRTFTDVVFPLILPIGGVIAVLCVIGSLKVFDIVQTMTNGGPYFATDVVATFVYRTAYSSTTGSPRLGYASAAALLFGLMVVTIGVVLNLVKNYFNKKRNV